MNLRSGNARFDAVFQSFVDQVFLGHRYNPLIPLQ
jgi:hypothetical protein